MALPAFVAALGFAWASAAPAVASPRICIYVEDRVVVVGSNTGHAFVQLLPDAGPQAGKRDLVYGFYPKVKWRFLIGGPGDIKSDAESGWRWKKCVSVTRAEYDKAAAQVDDDLKHTPDYALLKFNCVDWAFRIASAAGLSLPTANVPLTNVLDPERLAQSFKAEFVQQGSRNIPGGNAVFSNTGNVKPTDTADAPKLRFWTDSYGDLTTDARTAPRTLARNLEMTAHFASLSSSVIGQGRRLRVSLHVPGRGQAMTKLWFGDGTAALQQRTFVHSYRRSGTYRLVGIVIANATVYKFGFTVTVDRSDRSAGRAIQVPSDKPAIRSLPALPPAPPPPSPE